MNPGESGPAATAVPESWDSRPRVQTLVLLVATAAGIYLCGHLAQPFLAAGAWALALAVLFCPLHRRLEAKIKRPSLAAAITVLLAGLCAVISITFVGQQIIQESTKGAEMIKARVESSAWRQEFEARPRLVPVVDWLERRVDVPGTIQFFANWLTATAGSIVKGSVVQVIGACLTFYLLFFFLRDRRDALQALRALSPLSVAQMDHLFLRVSETIYATIYGTLAVAAAQGLLGGLMFWWLGISAPQLWGVVMAVLAMIPVLGAFVIWIPVALFLALEGSWGKALILSLWGMLVVGGIDNLLRPMLVGKRLKLHTIPIFMSVAGGLIVFGAAGLVLGPVALVITTELLEIWRARPALPSLGQAGEVERAPASAAAVPPDTVTVASPKGDKREANSESQKRLFWLGSGWLRK